MQPFSDGTNADKQYGKPLCGVLRPRCREKHSLIKSIDVAYQLLSFEALVEERLDDELGRAQEPIGESILLFFLRKYAGIEGVLVVGRHCHAETITFLLHNLIGEPRMSIGAFQNRRDSQSSRCF